ncbi:MAG: response regulator transcription factor [Phaeodactylibacter sp.]|nr:response regulator transcription factor [Phaeodactylibacter sp.]MCB9265652.1 response regulator transcription factor [Lewinellaceae bacterium]MCB9290914.1 response regulator transcription factor [Lewinellaceae bacterium]
MISVAIVDAKRDVREGVRGILEASDGFCCLGVYADGQSALDGLPEHPPDVLLIETGLPDMPGADCVRLLLDEIPGLRVIMFTNALSEEQIFNAFRSGALGYISKTFFPSFLLNAIQEVKSGGAPMSPSVARRVVSSFNQLENPLPSLSKREFDVMALLCKGYSYRKIGERLFVSPNTVRFHLKNIYRKLKVNSRHEAVIKAARVGMV